MLPLPVTAGLDWSAHAATTALVLRALVPAPARRDLAAPALAASVLIDLDHVPQALRREIGPGKARPVTHHLGVPLVPLALSIVAPRRGGWRPALRGVALGVAAHLGRDLFTGPGVRGIRWPMPAGAAIVAVLAVTGSRP